MCMIFVCVHREEVAYKFIVRIIRYKDKTSAHDDADAPRICDKLKNNNAFSQL